MKNNLLSKLENPDIFWSQIQKSDKNKHILISELKNALRDGLHLSKLDSIIEYVNNISNGDKNIKILDYGSGGGQLASFLYLLGYTSVTAIDVYDQKAVDELNLLYGELDMGGVEFYTYDTKTLPFKSKQFDLIISQQVIEHVGNIEQYIDECYRVLSKDGSVLLEFPHRMVPFDTHTRMWFVHYFPEFVKKYFYNKYREGRYTYFSKSLFLRMPSLYSLLFNKIFNKVEDLTIDRVGNFRYKDHYEGNKKIREAVDKIIHIPLVGYPLLRVLTLFVNKTIVLHK